MDAKVTWGGRMSFTGTADTGFEISLGASPSVGGDNDGFRPMELIAVGLAGCTAMDVAAILKKMKVELDEFTVDVEGDVSEDHPKRFLGMKIIYRVKGKNIKRKNIEKAVILSNTRYCGVSANYSKAFPITYEIIYEEL